MTARQTLQYHHISPTAVMSLQHMKQLKTWLLVELVGRVLMCVAEEPLLLNHTVLVEHIS